MNACDACLRRSGLVAALAGHLEIAWRQRRTALRDVLALGDEDLTRAVGAEDPASMLRARPAFAPGAIHERASAAGLRAICRCDAAYPPSLAVLGDAPAVLYCSGDPGLLGDSRAAAIVGTRRASAEGLEVSRGLGRGLAVAGVTVVSGMALGIDSAAHRGALDGHGATIAVLASGADVPYPRREAGLHAAIRERGLVVSEAPPGAGPHRWAFPARNRIIAALAEVTIVVEAAERSGSLITAEFAAVLGRDVAAVPGRAGSPWTRGSNGLLKDGAAVVLDAEDVLDVLFGTDRPRGPAAASPRLEPRLRGLLADVRAGRVTVPALVGAGHDPDAAVSGLVELELMGLVRRGPGGTVVAVAP